MPSQCPECGGNVYTAKECAVLESDPDDYTSNSYMPGYCEECGYYSDMEELEITSKPSQDRDDKILKLACSLEYLEVTGREFTDEYRELRSEYEQARKEKNNAQHDTGIG